MDRTSPQFVSRRWTKEASETGEEQGVEVPPSWGTPGGEPVTVSGTPRCSCRGAGAGRSSLPKLQISVTKRMERFERRVDVWGLVIG